MNTTPQRECLPTQKARKEAATCGNSAALATLAALVMGNPSQGLLDVAAAAGPRGFVAVIASNA